MFLCCFSEEKFLIEKKTLAILMVGWLLLLPTDIFSSAKIFTPIDNFSTNALGIVEDWRFTTTDSVYCSPAFIDINHDGTLEIIVCDYNSRVYCVDNQGIEKWHFDTEGSIEAAPAVADVNADGRAEVIVGDEVGQIYCLDENGNKLWNYSIENGIIHPPLVVDVENDGDLDILVACSPRLYCLDGYGNQVWNYTGSYPGSAPNVGDVDNDDENEIILLNALGMIQLKSDGTVDLINTNFDSNYIAEPVLTDLTNDNFLDLIFYEGGDNLYCLNASDLDDLHWYVLDLFENSDDISSPAIADINDDGKKEIIVSGLKKGTVDKGMVYCFNATGYQLWNFTTNGISRSSPAIADLDGDLYMEIMLGSDDGSFYGLNHIGAMLWNKTYISAVESAPLVVDIDKDGIFEILVGVSSSSLLCYDITGATLSGGTPWYRDRGTIFNTAFGDSDSDYIDDLNEPFYNCDYDDPDKDDDGLTDGQELISYMTDPTDTDTDDDNVADNVEINTYGSDPLDVDSDDDGLNDGEEVTIGLDGYVTDPILADTDEDGLDDGDEYAYGSNPNNPDSDGDGLEDGDEITYNTSPMDPDTDSDGFDDGDEVAAGTDPLDADDYPQTETPTSSTILFENILVSIAAISSSLMVLVILKKCNKI
ncbi:MAG: PQQ-binding-like beta-propeller repeat protein [Asgard group archaeon]|nr:PQQ-binding-like beta-propeller repeat protein [Asgard group archaeon]